MPSIRSAKMNPALSQRQENTEKVIWRIKPLAQAITLMLATGGVMSNAYAQQAFSAAWYAQKGAVRSAAAATGKLPNGMPAMPLSSGSPQQQRMNEQRQRAFANLNMAARNVAAQQAAQAAARLAALNGTSLIPDGLGEGGLKVDTNNLTAGWINANGPTQTADSGKTVVDIKQTGEKAILNWETFNVGKNTVMNFNQKGGSKADGTNNWIALNRINDPSGKPSQIAGQIKADGSVYIINRNGIIFTGSSQVNTRTLVASSLRLTDQQFNLGINKAQYFEDAYQGQGDAFGIPQFGEFAPTRPDINLGYIPSNGVVPDQLGGVDRFDPGAAPGKVEVQAGARIEVDSGGKIMLFAPKVINAGHLSAPDGQIILAAGENVYLNTSRLADKNGVRGLDVAVSAVPGWAFAFTHLYNALSTAPVQWNAAFVQGLRDAVLPEMEARAALIGYDVTNSGIVQADRGNITLQARDIHQNGVVMSTTALNNRNGSILMRAWGQGTHAYQNSDTNDVMMSWSSGTLTLGEGSVTQVMPDLTDASEIELSALSTRYQPGWITLYGKLIDLKPQAGVIAPSGTINVESAVNPFNILMPALRPSHLGDASRIYMDKDSYISVAGTQGALVNMSRNFVEAELRINELRDSPLLLQSWIRGKKIVVDRRDNGVFTDGPMAGVEWVKNKDGVYIPGSWVGTPLADVSGWVGVGMTDLSELSADAGKIVVRAGGSFISREGSMLDVSGGSVRYTDGINTTTKLKGADGRIYTIDKAMPDIEYLGLAGRYTQKSVRWGAEKTWRNPLIGGDTMEAGYTEGRAAGSVKIFAGSGLVLEGGYAGGVIVGERQQDQPSKNAGGKLEFGNGSVEERPWSMGELFISHDPHRLAAGFNSGSALGADFVAAPRPGRNEEPTKLSYILDDTLSESGMGSIDFNMRRDFTLEAGAVVHLSPGASIFVNEFENSTNTVTIDGVLKAAGGRIEITAANGTLKVGEHGSLDTGGQWINNWLNRSTPSNWAVNAGSIGLTAANLDIDKHAIIDVSGGGRVGTSNKGLPTLKVGNAGSISLAGLTSATDLGALDLRALAAGSAGTLAVTTDTSVQIGGTADGSKVWLPGDLYGERGFGTITINTKGDITVPDGAQVRQLPFSLDLSGFDYRFVASGESLASVAPVGILTVEQRYARKSTQLIAGTATGTITIGAGSTVQGDVGGLISFKTEVGTVNVHGTLEAAAGRIQLEGGRIVLNEEAQLLARGTPLIYKDREGKLTGQVLDGGMITIGNGSTLLELKEGSLIDVSGATGQIDGARDSGFSTGSVPMVTLDSNGGTISISGYGLVASTLNGKAGGPGAMGGRLELNLAAPVSTGGRSPLDQLSQSLVDPDCWGFSGDGDCSADWKQGLDYDWAPGMLTWGIDANGPMIVPSSLLAYLSGKDTQQIVLSETAAQPGVTPPLNPAQFGLTEDALDWFRDNFFYSELLRDALSKRPQNYALTVRPQNIAAGGFADLVMSGPVQLDQVNLTLGRSISIKGPLIGYNGTSSTLKAPHLILNATGEGFNVAAPAVSGAAGQLVLAGQLIDIQRTGMSGVAGTHIGGYARTVMEANEVRFAGELPAQMTNDANFDINLNVDGDLILRAGQIYPSTGMTGIVHAGNSITVERLGDSGQAPLSAGGILRLEAPIIEQNGVLRAPFGQIELIASDRLTLGAGSLTSVSGAGLNVPYGYLVNNEHWHDPLKATDGTAAGGSLTSPPEKRITLKSPNVDLASGALLDITGGGDLHAAEFVPGPGGSHDVLKVPGMYAIVPGYDSTAPVSSMPAGQRVWLAGGPGLAAGWYTLLPARFALMPGAFAIQNNGKDWAGAAGAAIGLRDGSFVTQGKQGNSLGGQADAVGSVWRVMSGSTIRKYTEYNEATANAFFSSDAFKLTQYRLTGKDIVTPRLTRDGGAVVFDATHTLVLDGTLLSQPDAGGRGGLVDIAGQKIAIVGAGQDGSDLRNDGYLVIDATSLSNFGAGSLLIGGKRSGDALGLRLDITASDIVVRNDASSTLFGPEIILAASDQVLVDTGSVMTVKGAASAGSGDLIIAPHTPAVYTDPDGQLDDNYDGVIDAKDAKDDVLTKIASDRGALLRMSSGDATKVVRQNVDTTQGGLIRIGEGAIISGGAALLIDATRTTELAGSAQVTATNLSVSAGRINFGGGTGGMVLDADTLTQLSNSKHLTLRSYSSFDFYRSLDLGASGLASFTFDGAAFIGHGNGNLAIKGDTLTFANSGSAGSYAPTGGSGNLSIDANTLVLGLGQKTFTGFGAITLSGRDQIVGEGKGGIDAGASPLTLHTPVLTGRGGANQSIVTQGDLRVLAHATAGTHTVNPQDSLGSSLALSGRNIEFSTLAQVLGGSIDMTTNGGDLVIADGAVLDVSGFAKQFFDVAEYADAGRIKLSANGGDILLSTGSDLNLAAHQNGGSAGTLTLAAAGGGTVVLDGAIRAQAGIGGKAGAFALDIAALPDFAAFSQRLNESGFNRSRQFRIREGDVVLDGLTKVEEFTLTADQGRIDITGSIDARSSYGGAIRIIGGDGVTMQNGAHLQAGASGDLGSGRVTLEAAGGVLDLQGGSIDVSGADGGVVRLRAQRNSNNDDIAVTHLNVSISGARSAVLEGTTVYNSTSVDAVKAQAIAEANAFASHAATIQHRLGSGIAVMAGIEIASQGDLSLASDWNLFNDFAGNREGTLTLRAAGNLLINGHLSDGFDQADRSGILQDAASWNMRLVAGADLNSADRLATQSLTGLSTGQGSVIVGTANTATGTDPDNGAGKLIRTGTGDIEVRAGRDLTLAHSDSVIYTAGRKDLTTWTDFTTARVDATYGYGGGNLDLGAQGNISAAPSDQRYTQWLNRQGNVNSGYFFGEIDTGSYGYDSNGNWGPLLHAAEQSSWWINYGEFRQGVAVFGGGNIKVSAGSDVVDLGVSLTTTMRMRGGLSANASRSMELRNGGAMTVDAGGALRGGQYYVARGQGDIRASEATTGRSIDVRYHGSGSGVESTVTYQIAPLLAIGDASMSLRTAGDLQLQTVLDPMLIRYGDGRDSNSQILDYGAYMSGYTPRTALNLSSTGGDVTLVNQGEFIFRSVDLQNNTTPENNLVGKGANRYPAFLHATAMNGSLNIEGAMYVMPGTNNDVRMLAQQDVSFINMPNAGTDSPFTEILMSRATPEMMPSPFTPVGGGGFPHQVDLNSLLRNSQGNEGYPRGTYYESLKNPEVLPLANDYEPSRIYAADGSILGLDVMANEQTWIRAGKDVRGVRLAARNNHAQDTTMIDAGNDIISMTSVRGFGPGTISVQGAGGLLLTAGRDVYADDLQIQTLGNQSFDGSNRPMVDTKVKGLPDQGASITVMAGMNSAAGYDAFASAYLDPSKVAAMPDYLKAVAADGSVLPIYLTDRIETRTGGQQKVTRRGLVSYMKDMTGEDLSPADAWTRFQTLQPLAQQQFLRQVYLLELREAGRNQSEPGVNGLPLNGGYNRGYKAIATLFPGDAWKGNFSANNMMLRTMSGGDINVLTPGGGLQVASLGATVPSGYGLVTLGSGHINVFAKEDVVVNQSRILSFVPEASMRGSDQIIWSSRGGIDAGRGSKTVRVPSAPEVVTDLDGNTTIREKSDMSGSGIGTVGDGDVDLAAPEGTINAGDAGIRVAGNLNIIALQVLNADNIKVKGEAKGLPVLASVNIGALTNASAAASQAAMAAQDVMQRDRNDARKNLPSIFTVRVLGFGNDTLPSNGNTESTPSNSSVQRGARYDNNSVFQVLGQGDLGPAQLARLTETERRQIKK